MEKETIKPLGKNVLVKVLKDDPKTKSGIVLPETVSAEKPQEGKVIAVGTDEKIKVKKGQKVIFAKYSGTELKIAGEDYLILKNEDILAVVE
ncbi:MAG: co-chaperone GroES [Candidatus Pacebacteria bacterium]|nr:co-chaperone GroES [Candidatus Paceibacterota bacterium]MDR3582817.1 co-chaperone GroES [Candidatus Paceibacterota bacterium]